MHVRWLLVGLLLALGVLPVAPPAEADSTPPNNKAGINVIRHFESHYLRAASQIVNSSGGDWGYVTVLLLSEDRQDPRRIQKLLDDANTFHLIPILRLGTHYTGTTWVKPGPDEPVEWKQFLSGLKWHLPATYLIVGNEPNLGFEWGGEVNPGEYARYLKLFIDTFAGQQPRFKLLNAPMDLSNQTGPGMMDDFEYLAAMRAEVPDIFSGLDGWASNPYHFHEGRGARYTYRGYTQELDFIGVELPVFVTESYVGFVHDPEQVARYFDTAFGYWLNDSRVVAATPQFFNPEDKRFWMFDADGIGNPVNLSPTAHLLRGMPKVAGSPNHVASLGYSNPARVSTNPAVLVASKQDYPIASGRFYTQTNGFPLGRSPLGYSVTDEGGIPFWREFQRLGGVDVLGYPVSRRFLMDGFVCQATQKYILQWRPEHNEAWFVNVFDALYERGKDHWLHAYRQTPPHPGSAGDAGLDWMAVMDRHWKILDADPKLKQYFLSDKNPISHFGLPIAYADMGNATVLRAQRAVFQRWKEDTPWAPAGYITVANGGDIAKESGLLPVDAVVLEGPPAANGTR